MPVALITGISGQDGSYLAESLVRQGYEVHGVIRSRSREDAGTDVLGGDVVLHEADITDTARLADLITDVSPTEIYSLAALSSVWQSWADPVRTAQINSLPVAQILESAWQLQEKSGTAVRVVQASSAELFGNASESPQTESTRIKPTSPYGAAKAYSHYMVGLYRERGLFASSCILYNHESPRRPETFVTRKITAAAARIARGLQTGLELGTLDTRRDWGWAPDYARALELAVRAQTPDDFIIATGETRSIADFVERAFARAGVDDWRQHVSVSETFARPLDSAEQLGDASKARRVLEWAPTKSFDEIVAAMVDNDLQLIDSVQEQ
ncbi:MAG: GDP-mannose 4,6-dehydratase [Microbacteriaceae bacterium]|jgi:GDPmannose 4,6-dehydratase|nr:GDP-mannose 4,6-dehydratase [Microbacteriaceae bacterium]